MKKYCVYGEEAKRTDAKANLGTPWGLLEESGKVGPIGKIRKTPMENNGERV
jgi:hypothetical protein